MSELEKLGIRKLPHVPPAMINNFCKVNGDNGERCVFLVSVNDTYRCSKKRGVGEVIIRFVKTIERDHNSRRKELPDIPTKSNCPGLDF